VFIDCLASGFDSSLLSGIMNDSWIKCKEPIHDDTKINFGLGVDYAFLVPILSVQKHALF
jgi:hypothetical protein